MYSVDKEIYVHYGSKELREITPVSDCGIGKPMGGFWGSRIGAKYGWKSWCKDNNFDECNENNSFRFTLKDNSKILEIHTIDDIKNYTRINGLPAFISISKFDFMKVLNEYDGIELFLSDDYSMRFNGFYAWDCDSIVIWNQNIIDIVY